MSKTKRRRWPKGHCHTWMLAHRDYQGDECVKWPFAEVRGYGAFRHGGKRHVAHRFMCELVNGPPPTPTHQAAHTCGKGHEGCINPRHLVWKTARENSLDRRCHGTAVLNGDGPRGRLTDAQWNEIRALRGQETQETTAKRYGISMRHVRHIQKSKRKPGFRFTLTAAQVDEIRASYGKFTCAVLAKKFNVADCTISHVALGRLYRRIGTVPIASPKPRRGGRIARHQPIEPSGGHQQ